MARPPVLALLLVTALGWGCGDDAPVNDRCDRPEPPATRGSRVVELGFLAPVDPGMPIPPLTERFTPYRQGETYPLTRGFQGGFMLLPLMRIERGDDTATVGCFLIEIDNELEGLLVEDFEGARQADLIGEHFYTDEIFNLIGLDREELAGRTLTMTVEVTGDDFATSVPPVSIVLE